MPNLIIYRTGSNKIKHFIKDCVQEGGNFIGSNKKIGVNLSLFSIRWTNDVANPVYNEKQTEIIKWDKAVSEMTETSDSDEIIKPTHTEHKEAIRFRSEISKFTYDQIDKYIDNNVTDIPSAKAYLKKLSKVVLGIIKMQDYSTK